MSVVCGESKFVKDKPDTLLNPTLIVEILSPSTEGYDRGIKFQHYRTLESLQEYVLINQNTAHIETYKRQGNQWLLTDTMGLEAAANLTSIDCVLLMADVYERVEFEADKAIKPTEDELT